MRRKPILLIACLFLFVVGGLFLWSRTKSSVPPFLVDAAPAFETLVRASRTLADNRADLPPDEFAANVEANAPALKMVREALNQKFEAPIAAYSMTTMPNVITELGSCKSLAIALKNEGLYHEAKTNYAKAAQSYLDIVHLGSKVQSGTIIFSMVGIALERIGLSALERLAPDLDPQTRKRSVSTLRSINSKRLSFPEIEQRERLIARRNTPTPLHYLIVSRFNRSVIANAQSKYQQASNAVEVLASKLATTD